MHRRKKLIFWRIEKRLRQKDVCEALGISVAHYSNLERGLSDPSYDLLLKFKDIYRINDILELFEKEHTPWQR